MEIMSIDSCKDCGQFTDTDIDDDFYFIAGTQSAGYCSACREKREKEIHERGDSAAAINKAADQDSWDRLIRPMMEQGAKLRYEPKTGNSTPTFKAILALTVLARRSLGDLRKQAA